jgi:Lipopolysaccharide kinase (Kdo/WaaP) family
MIEPAPPDGFERIVAGRCSVTVRSANADDARALLTEGTPYEAAARDLAARPLEGRGVAYAITLLASGDSVVVRRNRHGGLLATMTGTLFVPPSRAPYELSVSLRLAKAGVRTPAVVMYALERVHGLFCHADVVTSEIADSRDLSTYMQTGVPNRDRMAAWSAARDLLATLNAAGARHHDLNVKNILLAARGNSLTAWVLDVDRVAFSEPGSESVRRGNAKRLLRSALKWRELRGASFSDEDASLLERVS